MNLYLVSVTVCIGAPGQTHYFIEHPKLHVSAPTIGSAGDAASRRADAWVRQQYRWLFAQDPKMLSQVSVRAVQIREIEPNWTDGQ